MPRWTPELEWKGEDAFIIGGGPSLRGFDFARLEGRKTIGCNSAFMLGARICNVCFFSDPKWFDTFFTKLCSYGGRIVTHSEEVPDHLPWVWKMARMEEGLHEHALGYGGNTGCGAINLALLLGARRVFLLGFDCKLGEAQRMNWHDHRYEPPCTDPELFQKFFHGFLRVSEDLPIKFPEHKVINLGPDSALPTTFFPKQDLDEVLR